MSGSSKTVQVNIVGDSSKLQSAASKGGSALSRFASHVHNTWSAIGSAFSNSSIGEEFSNLTGMFSGLGSVFSDLKENGMHVGTMLVGIGGAATAAGSALEMMASPVEAAHNMLAQSYSNIGSDMSDYTDQIGRTIDEMTKYGYTSDVVQNSLSTLVVGTHSATKGFDLIKVAANLAAKENISLQKASTQVVQLLAGKGTRALSMLGIQTTTATTATKVLTAEGIKNATAQELQAATVKANAENQALYQQRLEEVSKLTRGDASASADTFAGKIKAIRAEVMNAVMDFAAKWGPTIQMAGIGVMAFGGAIDTAKSVMGLFTTASEGAGAAQEGLAAAAGTAAAAEDAEAVSAAAADAATLPIEATVLLIVAAVAALGIGIYELFTHWKTVWNGIKDVVDVVWHFIYDNFIEPFVNAFSMIVDWVRSHWQMILSILLLIMGPIGIVIDLFWHFHDQIAEIFDDVWHFIDHVWQDVVSGASHMIDDVVNFFESLPGKVVHFIENAAGSVLRAFEKWIPGGGIIGGALHFLGLATGGIVSKPTLAVVGESGPEAVIPLNQLGSGVVESIIGSNDVQSLPSPGGAVAAGGTSASLPDVYLQIDGQTFARIVWPQLRTHALQTTARNARMVGLT